MKSLVFIFLLLTIISVIPFAAVAQKLNHSGITKSKVRLNQPVKFIEGIEIKREIIPSIVTETPVVKGKNPRSLTQVPGIEKTNSVQFKYAQLLNRDVEAVNNTPLFNFIEDWWQTKYSYGGNTKKGIDCSGFASQLFLSVYATEIPRTAREEFNACEKIVRNKLGEGDLVFFNTQGGVSHVGVYLGEGYFVHASTINGVTINNLDDDYYSARFLGGGRILNTAGSGLLGTR